MALRVYNCNAPTKPSSDFQNTINFGIPKGIEGRNGNTIKGIVIHCIPNAISFFDTMANRDWRLGDKATPKVTSVHYAVGQSGSIRQYVCDTNIAWGFAPQLTNVCAEPVCALDWSLVTANPNVSADEYILHIALEKPIKPKGTNNVISNDACGCAGATVLSDNGYERLVNLLAWLVAEYSITISEDFIQFAQNIVKCPVECGELYDVECECADLNQLLCDVRDYCERCKNPRDTSFTAGSAIVVYGENGSECKTKQSVHALLADRLKFNAGVLGIVDDNGVWTPISSM